MDGVDKMIKDRWSEPLPNETTKQFEAFCVYRDMGRERSIEKVSKKLSKSTALIQRWSSKNDWINRVAEYDAYLEKERLKEINKKHKQITQLMLKRAIDGLKRKVEKGDDVSDSAIISYIDKAVNIERLIEGLSNQNIELKQTESIVSDIHQLYEIYLKSKKDKK